MMAVAGILIPGVSRSDLSISLITAYLISQHISYLSMMAVAGILIPGVSGPTTGTATFVDVMRVDAAQQLGYCWGGSQPL
jgi:hypothetical protein